MCFGPRPIFHVSLNIENFGSLIAFCSVSKYPIGKDFTNMLYINICEDHLNAVMQIGP